MEYALILILLHTLTGKVSFSNEGLTCSFEIDFCGWSNINDEWERKTESGLSTTGPSAADDGTYYIQINTVKLEHFSTITAPYQRTLGPSCLNFKYHLYGRYVEHLRYGYYTDTNKYHEVRSISDRENFWACATFNLSSLPESAKGIYFQGKSGTNVFSIIGLDSFRYNTGNDCSSSGEFQYDTRNDSSSQCEFQYNTGNDCSSQECPVPPTKTTTTTVSSTTTETATQSNAKYEKWIIIGGSCGGLVILVIIIVTVCIIKMRKRRSKQFLSKTTSPETRALPPIPLNESTVHSIAGSYRRKFSVNPTHPETNDFSKSSTEGTDHEYHSIIEETKPYDYGYVDLPPDYDINENEPFDKDKSSNNSEQDSDYLEPSVGLNSGNQYESDPTEKGKLKSTELKNNQEPSVHHIEIPAIPVMTKTKVSHTSCNEIEIDDDYDYDDAIAATTTDGNGQISEESEKSSNTEENDKDDYLNVTDDDDYITPTST